MRKAKLFAAGIFAGALIVLVLGFVLDKPAQRSDPVDGNGPSAPTTTGAQTSSVAPTPPAEQPAPPVITYPREISGPLVVVDSRGEPVEMPRGSVRFALTIGGIDAGEAIARITPSRWTLRIDREGILKPTTLALLVSLEPRKSRRAKCDPVSFGSDALVGPTIRAVAEDE